MKVVKSDMSVVEVSGSINTISVADIPVELITVERPMRGGVALSIPLFGNHCPVKIIIPQDNKLDTSKERFKIEGFKIKVLYESDRMITDFHCQRWFNLRADTAEKGDMYIGSLYLTSDRVFFEIKKKNGQSISGEQLFQCS